MTGDSMEIVNPNTGGKKFVVDSNNKVVDRHDCTFSGDHSNGLDVEDKCTICGKALGDLIAEDYDPTRPNIPIIIVPEKL
jgi:hypothetical protein